MSAASSPANRAARVPVVVVAPPEVDLDTAAELRAALLRAAARIPTVVLDLSGTQFCDSAGLSVLVRAHRRALAEGGELRLVVSTPQVERILSLTGLDRWIPCYADEATAMAVPVRPRRAAGRGQPMRSLPAPQCS
jgi:anti-sigma B factor antagonist